MPSKHRAKKNHIKKQCAKCNDMFIPTYGGISERHSCRQHEYSENDICLHCDSHKSNHNCYHIVRRDKICVIL